MTSEGRTLSPTHREVLLRTAALAGWAARPRDPQVLTTEQADAISHAAAEAVLDRLAEWEAQSAAPAESPDALDAWHRYDPVQGGRWLRQGVSFLVCMKDGRQYAAPLGTPEPEGCLVMVVQAS